MELLENLHAGRHALATGLLLALACLLLGGGAGGMAGKLAEALGFVLRREGAAKRRFMRVAGAIAGTITGAACGAAAYAAGGRETHLGYLGLLGFFGLAAGSFLGSWRRVSSSKKEGAAMVKEGAAMVRARLLAWHFLGAELETVLASAAGAGVGMVYGGLVGVVGGGSMVKGLLGAGIGLAAGAVGGLLGARGGRLGAAVIGMVVGTGLGAGIAVVLERIGGPERALIAMVVCEALGGAALGLIGAEWARDKRQD